jgi:hypothetical protein
VRSVIVAAPWKALFDGTGVSFNRWVRVDPNNSSGFALINGEVRSQSKSNVVQARAFTERLEAAKGGAFMVTW